MQNVNKAWISGGLYLLRCRCFNPVSSTEGFSKTISQKCQRVRGRRNGFDTAQDCREQRLQGGLVSWLGILADVAFARLRVTLIFDNFLSVFVVLFLSAVCSLISLWLGCPLKLSEPSFCPCAARKKAEGLPATFNRLQNSRTGK